MTGPTPQLGRAFHIISKRQQDWARESGIPFGNDYSVASYEDNLFRPLRPETRKEFASADGKELDGKLKKLYSSAALVANVSDYWRDQPRVAGACFDMQANASISFEKDRSIFDGILPYVPQRKNPSIDVELSQEGSSANLALECKFAEPFMKYPQKRRAFTSTYFCQAAESIWKDMDRTRALALRLNEQPSLFTRLDASQLIKTALACKRAFASGRWNLIYLWFDVAGDSLAADECHTLSDELNYLREQTQGEIPLRVVTWQELFARLKALSMPAHSRYIAYLESRYFRYA